MNYIIIFFICSSSWIFPSDKPTIVSDQKDQSFKKASENIQQNILANQTSLKNLEKKIPFLNAKIDRIYKDIIALQSYAESDEIITNQATNIPLPIIEKKQEINYLSGMLTQFLNYSPEKQEELFATIKHDIAPEKIVYTPTSFHQIIPDQFGSAIFVPSYQITTRPLLNSTEAMLHIRANIERKQVDLRSMIAYTIPAQEQSIIEIHHKIDCIHHEILILNHQIESGKKSLETLESRWNNYRQSKIIESLQLQIDDLNSRLDTTQSEQESSTKDAQSSDLIISTDLEKIVNKLDDIDSKKENNQKTIAADTIKKTIARSIATKKQLNKSITTQEQILPKNSAAQPSRSPAQKSTNNCAKKKIKKKSHSLPRDSTNIDDDSWDLVDQAIENNKKLNAVDKKHESLTLQSLEKKIIQTIIEYKALLEQINHHDSNFLFKNFLKIHRNLYEYQELLDQKAPGKLISSLLQEHNEETQIQIKYLLMEWKKLVKGNSLTKLNKAQALIIDEQQNKQQHDLEAACINRMKTMLYINAILDEIHAPDGPLDRYTISDEMQTRIIANKISLDEDPVCKEAIEELSFLTSMTEHFTYLPLFLSKSSYEEYLLYIFLKFLDKLKIKTSQKSSPVIAQEHITIMLNFRQKIYKKFDKETTLDYINYLEFESIQELLLLQKLKKNSYTEKQIFQIHIAQTSMLKILCGILSPDDRHENNSTRFKKILASKKIPSVTFDEYIKETNEF